ncbi:hypothetical protein ACHHYP_13019 [Achlya hypogyna]|uniref:Uncharacterized protein n=1 Tax=Achlya hypogyna TaxID=1202772 RepID=A0A1V9YG66_ACHHY|nr:hypothetical protein ACHHYP_13019 [Achlya hypogyna]
MIVTARKTPTCDVRVQMGSASTRPKTAHNLKVSRGALPVYERPTPPRATSPCKVTRQGARLPLCSPKAAYRKPTIIVSKHAIEMSIPRPVGDEDPETPDRSRIQELAKHTPGQTIFHPDIDFDGLRPLIDIAYWSSFAEVRRDAAAAFCTLSKNTANLETMAQAGALGAALALLATNKHAMDLAIVRDATDTLAALAQLPSMQRKLLGAPTGLSTVFSLLRVADVRVKRAVLKLLGHLLEVPEASALLVDHGCFNNLLHLVHSLSCRKDRILKRLAVGLLQLLATPEANKQRIAEDDTSLPQLCALFQDPYLEVDAGFRKALLECILALSHEKHAARRLVECRIVPALLFVLTTASGANAPAMDLLLLVLAVLDQFSTDPRMALPLLQHDVVPTLVAVGFATDERDQLHRPLMTKALGILAQLTKRAEAHATAMDVGVVDRISQYKLFHAPERVVREYSLSILVALAKCVTLPRRPRLPMPPVDHACHMELVARGYLHCAFAILGHANGVYELVASSKDSTKASEASDEALLAKIAMLNALTHLTESNNIRVLVCKPAVLDAVLDVARHKTALVTCAKLVADLSSHPDNLTKLVEPRLLLLLLKFIAPSCRDDDVRYEGARAFAALAAFVSMPTRERLVAGGVVGFLMRLAKHAACEIPIVRGTALLAQTAIGYLKHDAAALRIQTVMRNWRAKHVAADIKEAAAVALQSPHRRRFKQIALRATRAVVAERETRTNIQQGFLAKKGQSFN